MRSSSIPLLLLSLWALVTAGTAASDAHGRRRRRNAVSSTTATTPAATATTDDQVTTRPPHDDDALNEQALLQGRGPKEEKTPTLEPTPNPETGAPAAPSPSPTTSSDLGPATDDDRSPHDNNSNNKTASSAMELSVVDLASFRVTYDPSAVSLDHVLADYESLLVNGFVKEYPNVHNVSLWNASAVTVLLNNSSHIAASKTAVATTTVRGRIWFRGSAPSQDDVRRLELAILATRANDKNDKDTSSEGAATPPAVTAGAIGGAIGLIVGAVLAVLAGRRCWRNKVQVGRESKGRSSSVPFTGADLVPPSSGPDRHVQFRFHHSGTQTGATDSGDSGEEGSMETNALGGEDEDLEEVEVPLSPPRFAAAPEAAPHDSSAASFEMMMLATGRKSDLQNKTSPPTSEAPAAAAAYRMGAAAAAALGAAPTPRPLPPSHHVWEPRTRGTEPRRRSVGGGGGGCLPDDDDAGGFGGAGAIGWTVSPSFQIQQARPMSP